MREDERSRDRVSRRSSTGIKKDAPERERRQRIRMFEDTDDLYGDDGREERERTSYDTRRRWEDGRDGAHDRRRDDRYRADDEYYRDREDRRRDEYERERYDDRRRDDRRRDDRYREDSRREERYEDSRRHTSERREPPRKQAGGPRKRKVGGDTDRFAHQIIPYAMFWVALFGAVSLILRDFAGTGDTTGAFGNWFANFLCGLLGPIAYALPVFLVVLALRWKRFVREDLLAKKLLLSISFLVLLSAIVHVFMESKITRGVIDVNGGVLYNAGANMSGGGFFGGFVGEYIGYVLRAVGTGLLCIPLLLIIGIYLVGLTPGALWQRLAAKCKQISDRRRERDRVRYSGEEQRRLHNSRRNKEAVVKYEEKKPRVEKKKSKADEPVQYEFREEDDELETVSPDVTPQQPDVPKREEAPIEMVDIPDDEPEEPPVQGGDAVLRRAGGIRDSEQALRDILAEMGSESEAKATTRETTPASPAVPAASAQEERPLQGNYYSPFSLTHRKKLHEDAAAEPSGRIVIDPVTKPTDPVGEPSRTEEALGTAEPKGAVETSYENGVLTERHGTTTIYKKAPTHGFADATVPAAAAEPTLRVTVEEPASPAVQPSAPMAEGPGGGVSLDQADEILSGMAFADEEPAEEPAEEKPAAVPFQREKLTSDYSTPAVKETPAPKAPVIADDTVLEDEDDEIVPGPAIGVRTSFTLPGEEPVKKPEEREPVPAKPVEQRPVRPMQTVPSRPEPVKSKPAPAPEPPPTPREHKYPPITLLNEDKSVKGVDHSEEIREKIDLLRQTLADFNVRIREHVECARGPAITRYELRPEAGVSVRQVINRQDDIALALAAEIRIEAPIPGKPAIGIEVPNAVRETVYMRTMLESDEFKNSTKPLEVPLGMGIGGNIQMCNLAAMPHLLVAGTTGSGKSVCINTILISLMYKTSPRDLRLILIDPKQVEFAAYAHVPHLYAPIVTENARAVGALACAVQEMERRYSLIKDVGVRDIDSYNEAVKNDPEREHLPRMVIVIDEFADLKMGCTTNDPENFTCRIAQKARAAGMHLIIGTQRPSVDVITGKLKNNIPSRIAFTVKQQVDSRTILDANGAESLTGKGDMLYMPIGSQKPARVQGAFVSDGEVERVISYIRDHNDPVQYNQAFMDQIEVEMARAANTGRKGDDFDDIDEAEDGGEDPKFREAVELAIETQKVATSLLQRRLGVGYGRAAKIIDRMEALGYVSAPEGNKARKVLITAQEYAARMMEGGDGDFEDDEYNA